MIEIEHKNLATAMVAASAEVNNPNKKSTNPHLKNKFADLKEVLATTKPVLARHGLVLMQLITGTAATQNTVQVQTITPDGVDPKGVPKVATTTTTTTTSDAGNVSVRTILVHAASCETMESTQSLRSYQPGTNEAQSAGIAITYIRRYAILALLGIVGDEDGDGANYDFLPQPQVIESLVNDAKAAASLGMNDLQAHWRGLSPKDREALTPILPELKKLAGG